MFLLKMINSVCDDQAEIDRDYNHLLSHCNDVISAEVPAMLRDIAMSIENRELVKRMTDEELLCYLQSGKTAASEKFEKFLITYGHRGYREMDPYFLPWGKNPLPVVQVIKSIVASGNFHVKEKKSTDELLNEMEVKLTGWKRALMKYFLIPYAQKGVGYRELSKSLMVKMMSLSRDAYWTIAENMRKHGILPETELLFFLRIDEIDYLLRKGRDPALVMKAKQRRRLYPGMHKLKFDEFIKGMRMGPRESKPVVINTDSSVMLKGTAVTVGDIKARICVAETIDEAVNIRNGDILVTYSTDIGWSPYFALLSGIVTEIGGTISHGSVIAREFGLPCLIAVEDACSAFQTGDIGYLDTKTGTIVKVIE